MSRIPDSAWDPAPVFDLAALYSAVDARRVECGLSWAAVARESGLAPSTIKRFASAEDSEADGVLNVIRWLGVAPETFVRPMPHVFPALLDATAPVVRIDQAQLRLRPNQRTGIGALTAEAHRRGVAIAALTRASEW